MSDKRKWSEQDNDYFQKKRTMSSEKKVQLTDFVLDLPNDILSKILMEKSAADYINLSQINPIIQNRLRRIDDQMYRFYLRKDYNTTVPKGFDAKTSYLVTRANCGIRYVSVWRLEDGEFPFLVRQLFFKSNAKTAINEQVANLLEKDEDIMERRIVEAEEGNDMTIHYDVVISGIIKGDSDEVITDTRIEANSINNIIRQLKGDINSDSEDSDSEESENESVEASESE